LLTLKEPSPKRLPTKHSKTIGVTGITVLSSLTLINLPCLSLGGELINLPLSSLLFNIVIEILNRL